MFGKNLCVLFSSWLGKGEILFRRAPTVCLANEGSDERLVTGLVHPNDTAGHRRARDGVLQAGQGHLE
eukprot:3403886-Amphidinium_carterae.1